jgi:pyridinium-3,5-biscarboxylic acid mononucleotide sulfurtransferase
VSEKAERLLRELETFERVAVAVSGGVDSMTLAWFAHRALGPQAVMYHAVSSAVPPEATARVRDHAERHAWRLVVVDAGELSDAEYVANPTNRCYFCKRDLYGTIRGHTTWPIVSGTNLDDLEDIRPGLLAAAGAGVRHPYVECGIDKQGVRELAAGAGLDDLAELPASPCLASRIETGISVSVERLTLIYEVERFLQQTLSTGGGRENVRCRLRSRTLEIELEAVRLNELDQATRQELVDDIMRLQAGFGWAAPVRFGVYRRGSAFVDRISDESGPHI